MYAENVLVDNCCLSCRAAELGVCATSHKEISIVVTGHVMVVASMHCWRDTMQNAPPLDGPREVLIQAYRQSQPGQCSPSVGRSWITSAAGKPTP